jgi:hypothetical protein
MIVYINRHLMSRNFFGRGICLDEALLPRPRVVSLSLCRSCANDLARIQLPGKSHPASSLRQPPSSVAFLTHNDFDGRPILPQFLPVVIKEGDDDSGLRQHGARGYDNV